MQICLLPAVVAGLQNCPTWPSVARVIKVASGAHAAAADRNLSSSSCAPSLYWFPAATNGTARHGERWIDGKRLVIARDGIDALIRSAGPGRDGRTGRRPRRDKDEGSAHHCTGIGSAACMCGDVALRPSADKTDRCSRGGQAGPIAPATGQCLTTGRGRIHQLCGCGRTTTTYAYRR